MTCCADRNIPIFAEKDPDDTTDYAFNWVRWLDGDQIVASEFILPDGLTKVGAAFSNTQTQIVVSGGKCGPHRITNRITTAAGRVKDKTIRILVRQA